MAENNNFWLDLIASLQKGKSKKQIKEDIKNLGNIYVPLIGKLNKSKTKSQISQDLKSINNKHAVVLNTKVNSKGVVKAVKQTAAEAQSKIKIQPIQFSFSVNKDKLIDDIKILGQQNTKLFKDVNMTVKYNQLLDNAKLATSNVELRDLRLQLAALKSELKANHLAGLTLGDTFKKTFKRATELFAGTGGIMMLSQQLRNSWEEALKLDNSLTALGKVADELSDRKSFPDYLDKCITKARELKVDVISLIDATTEFKRQGFSLEQSEQLSEVAVMLENVGDMSIEDSIKTITSNLQAFDEIDNYTKDQYKERAIAIADKINNISNNYSIDAEGLANALRECSAVMAEGNTTLDQSAALISAGNRTYQDPTYLGNSLKILTLRLRGAKTELQSLNENTDDMAESTSKLREQIKALTNVNGTGGFDIMDDEDTFKSVYDIMLGISDVFSDMNDVDQASLLELIAGKHRSAAVASILDNMSEAQDIYTDSLKSSQSATKEFERYQNSAEAATQNFKNNMIETYNQVIGGDAVKAIANAGSATMEFANSLGLVDSTLKGLLAIGALKAITTFSVALKSSAIQAANFSTALDLTKTLGSLNKGTAAYKKAFNTLKIVSNGLTEVQLKQVLASNNLTQSQKLQILQYQGLTKEQAKAKLAQLGLIQTTNAQNVANNTAAGSTFKLSAAVKGFGLNLKAAFMTNPVGITIMALSVAFGAISTKIQKYNQELEEARQKNIEAADSASEKAQKISELYDKYTDLAKITDKTDAQEEDFKTTIKEITTALGEKTTALEGLTAGTKDYTDALKGATKAELESLYTTAVTGRKSAEEQLQKDVYSEFNGSAITIQLNEQMVGVENHVKALETVRELLADYEDVGTFSQEWEPINWDEDHTNMEEVVEYYNALVKAREKLIMTAQQTDDDTILDSDIYKDIDATINKLQTDVDIYAKKRYEELKLEYEMQKGIPTTVEEYQAMQKSLLETSNTGEYFNSIISTMLNEDFSGIIEGVEGIKDAEDGAENSANYLYDSIKLTKDQIIEMYNLPNTEKNPWDGLINSAEEYTKSLKSIRSQISTVSDALEEFDKNGTISAETAVELVETNSDYGKALEYTADGIKLDTVELKKQLKVRVENLKMLYKEQIAEANSVISKNNLALKEGGLAQAMSKRVTVGLAGRNAELNTQFAKNLQKQKSSLLSDEERKKLEKENADLQKQIQDNQDQITLLNGISSEIDNPDFGKKKSTAKTKNETTNTKTYDFFSAKVEDLESKVDDYNKDYAALNKKLEDALNKGDLETAEIIRKNIEKLGADTRTALANGTASLRAQGQAEWNNLVRAIVPEWADIPIDEITSEMFLQLEKKLEDAVVTEQNKNTQMKNDDSDESNPNQAAMDAAEKKVNQLSDLKKLQQTLIETVGLQSGEGTLGESWAEILAHDAENEKTYLDKYLEFTDRNVETLEQSKGNYEEIDSLLKAQQDALHSYAENERARNDGFDTDDSREAQDKWLEIQEKRLENLKKPHQDTIDELDRFNSEYEHRLSMLDETDKDYYSDKTSILIEQAQNEYKVLEENRKELERIDALYANNPNNIAYLEYRQDLTEAIDENTESLKGFNDEIKETSKAQIDAAVQLEEDVKSELETYLSNKEDAYQEEIDLEQKRVDAIKKANDKEIEALEDRKQAYQDLWDMQDEDRDRQDKLADRAKLANEKNALDIASVTGDLQAMADAEDLSDQIADLDKELAKDAEQQWRDSVIESIDSQIEALNDQNKKLDEQITKMEEQKEILAEANERMLTGETLYNTVHALINGLTIKLPDGSKVTLADIRSANDTKSGENKSYGYEQSEYERKLAEAQAKNAIDNLESNNKAAKVSYKYVDGKVIDSNGNEYVKVELDDIIPNIGMSYGQFSAKLNDAVKDMFGINLQKIIPDYSKLAESISKQTQNVNVTAPVNVNVYGNLDNVTKDELKTAIESYAPMAVAKAFEKNIGRKNNLARY